MAIENSTITVYSPAQVTDSQWWTTDSGGRSSAIAGLTAGENIFQDLPLRTEVSEYDYAIIPCGSNDEIRIKVHEFESNGYWYTSTKIHQYTNGTYTRNIINDNYFIQYGNQVVPEWSIAFGIDRDNEAGYLTIYQFDYGSTYYSNAIPLACTRKQLYDLLIAAEPSPISNWLSVQSLTGQGITIQLSTSTDTNNGEAITTSDTTKFALTAESNINKLIVDRLARGN